MADRPGSKKIQADEGHLDRKPDEIAQVKTEVTYVHLRVPLRVSNFRFRTAESEKEKAEVPVTSTFSILAQLLGHLLARLVLLLPGLGLLARLASPTARKVRVRMPPGNFAVRFAEVFMSQKAVERYVKPAVADFQHEHFEALRSNRKKWAAWVVVRGYFYLVGALFCAIPARLAKLVGIGRD